MVGGVGEYLSLVTGFRTLLLVIAAVLRRRRPGPSPLIHSTYTAGSARHGATADTTSTTHTKATTT